MVSCGNWTLQFRGSHQTAHARWWPWHVWAGRAREDTHPTHHGRQERGGGVSRASVGVVETGAATLSFAAFCSAFIAGRG